MTCHTANAATGAPIAFDDAYMVGAGIYLRLGSMGDTLQSTTTYSSIETGRR